MKPCFLFFIMATCLVFNGLSQTGAPKKNSPKEDFKVNREYDEQGNLIRFDSTYTYSWSSDSTLQNSLSFKDFDNLFGDNFSFFNDSAFTGHSFFDDFDQLSARSFIGKRDSVLMKKFGLNPLFHNIRSYTDSLAFNFKDFDSFFDFRENKSDSILSKFQGQPLIHSQLKSMDEMMKLLQQQMLEMDEYQRKFFKTEPKLKEF
ncbi:MAG TPA: hypothetical protein DCR40_20290 [Prolixibacteraceae bacterium]|nr:hypothetical protein [Prolixibacteraceae bacterium]